jgi:uncharacterized YigZ family protein
LRDSYLTIAATRRAELKIKRSRFIATAVPADSRAAAEREYRTVQQCFHDAGHNCFAFQTGTDDAVEFRYGDDGEPSGTAGKPIYDTICAQGLTNLLVVVSRYFGGIKLGTGGLARAYRDSARLALAEAAVVEKLILQRFRITFDHQQTSVAMKLISDHDLAPLETRYGDMVTIELAIRAGGWETIRREFVERSHGRIRIEEV